MSGLQSLLADEMSNVWIYSLNPKTGLRAHCQLPKAILSQPTTESLNLVDNVSLIAHRFDQLSHANVDQYQIDTLMAGATIYAKASKAWAMLSSHSDAPSVHLVVLDWLTQDGPVMKLIAANGEHAKALTNKSVEHVARETLESHLLKFPEHKPVA